MTIRAHGYATHSAMSQLAPFAFERRDPHATDVAIDIPFCGVCHCDIHSARDELGGCNIRSFPDTSSSDLCPRSGATISPMKPDRARSPSP